MTKKKKYSYNKDLRIYSLLNPPVILPLLPVMQFFMKSFYLTDLPDKKLTKEKLTVPLSDGKSINALVYSPSDSKRKNMPCIIFYHGGGFVYNAAPHHFTRAKNLARLTGAKVIFPDYRLAPKHPFPAAVTDAFDAYLFIRKNAFALGIDERKIVLCGDSAGGNLCAVTCLIDFL